jgi:DNA segregation ATPase FtsK/SpoIIIE-like protein
MSTKTQKKTQKPNRVVAIVLFALSAFVAAALATEWGGPVGESVYDACHGLLGALAWVIPVELALAAVSHLRGTRSRLIAAFVLGDAAGTVALAVLFSAGSLGAMIGTDSRLDIGGVGTLLLVTVVIGVLAVGRLSLFGRAVGPFVRPLAVKAIARAKERFDAWRRSRKTVIVKAPNVVIDMSQPKPVVAEAPAAASPLAQPVTRAERPLAVAPPQQTGRFTLPTLDFLKTAKETAKKSKPADDASRLVSTLAAHDVEAKVENVLAGPTVTTFEVSLGTGVKVAQVKRLIDDLSLTFGRKIRLVGASAGLIGFEVPNATRDGVNLRELLEDDGFQKADAALPVVLGRDMQGKPVYADVAAMPHVIVAGASGSGKSVGLSVMLASLLCKKTPDELRFIMIDPKVVELAPYNKIPHMLMPVVTDMKEAAAALAWTVEEMERRYQMFAQAGSKNIASFNAKTSAANRLPYIVVVIDEFADLIMQQGKEVEASVVRLGQKARAAGIHMVLATQRPSVDVITGTIKANFSSRIAYRVAQAVDSRTILDETGAEALLGMGDCLVRLNGASDSRRVQCPMITEEEIEALTDAIRPEGRSKKTPKINVITNHAAQA